MGEIQCEAAQLTAAVAPVSLRDVLESLRAAGALTAWRERDGVVTIAGDLVALELAVALGDGVGQKLGLEVDDVAHGRRLGFRVSGDIDGRRGSPTAKAADMEATRSYYERAQVLLHDRSLSARARRIWELHVEGMSEERIAAQMGMARRRVVRALCVLRYRAGLTKELAGWAMKSEGQS